MISDSNDAHSFVKSEVLIEGQFGCALPAGRLTHLQQAPISITVSLLTEKHEHGQKR
jgi:hypothetical protein